MSVLRETQPRTMALAGLIVRLLTVDPAYATEPPNGLAGTFGESMSGASVVPASGAMAYTIPFALPPARGGAQPTLGLGYVSGVGTGEAGVGWSLNLPMIERVPLSGWPHYKDNGKAADEDRFAYNGRPLTFICVVGGAAGGPACPDSEAVGPMPDWAHGYRHYRLQVESTFERFFWSPGHSRWVVQRRGGELLEFGMPLTRVDLQLTSPYDVDTRSGKTFRWYLAVQRDLHGDRNIVYYRWAGTGERKHLRDIYYTPPAVGGSSAPLGAFAYHVELRWENPPYRQEDFTFADKRPHYRRLRRVAISAKSWANDREREMVRAYNLTYFPERSTPGSTGEAPLWGRSSLQSVTLEGRCAAAVREINGFLPDPTNCPSLPPVTFDYQPAQLASGAATRIPLDGPGASDGLPYVVNSAVIDVNRDGLPDIVQAWPTNFHAGPSHTRFNDCLDGEIRIDAGAGAAAFDPQLSCYANDPLDGVSTLRPARQQTAWVNRGAGIGGLVFEHHCLDAGNGSDHTLTHYHFTGPGGLVNRDPSLFSQYGAEAVGEWGDASLLWSLAGYHGFGFAKAHRQAETVPPPPLGPDDDAPASFDRFCPEGATDPKHPALRWVKTGDAKWAKDPLGDDHPERHYFSMVDIDGDGYADLLTEPSDSDAGNTTSFTRAAVRFSRRISGLQQIGLLPGPALHPFGTSDSTPITIAPFVQDYATYADINGDGVLDLVTALDDVAGGTPEVRLGDGRGGFGCDAAADIACQVGGNGSWLSPAYRLFSPDSALFPSSLTPWPLTRYVPYANGATYTHFFHDVTGDGLADIVGYRPLQDFNDPSSFGRVKLWINVDGRTFRCANSSDCIVATIPGIDQPSAGIPKYRVVFADINANGSEDFVLVGEHAVWSFSFLVAPPVPTVGPRSPRPGLLTRVRNGVGADTEIVYETIQELDHAANDPNPQSFHRPWANHLPQVIPVVTRIVTRDTASVVGMPLAQPYGFDRQQRFEYRDPAYDPWERSFKGFRRVRSIAPGGEVEQTWFHFGDCEAGPFISIGCLRTSDGGGDRINGLSTYPEKALVGAVTQVDRFLPGDGQRPVQWLSTTTTAYEVFSGWIQPPGTTPDRPVAWARAARIDTYLYDTAKSVSLADESDLSVGSRHVPRQNERVHLRRETLHDGAGNVRSITDHGRVDDAGNAIDDTIISRWFPVQQRCKSNWACSIAESKVGDQASGNVFERELRHTKLDYNSSEDVVAVWGRLFATSSQPAGLERDLAHGVGAPASADTTPGMKKLRELGVDALGNLVSLKGQAGPNQPCALIVFDTPFRQYPESVSKFARGACAGGELTSRHAFDRGLGLPTSSTLPNSTMGMVEYDAFGRAAKLHEPVAQGGPLVTALAVTITHHTQAPLSWVEVKHRVDNDQFRVSIDLFNGIGESVLGFDQADVVLDGSPWILRDWTERDGRGLIATAVRPWFFSGDAVLVANTAQPLVAAATRLETVRDAFGRVVAAMDGPLVTATFVYRPLEIHFQDAEQGKTVGAFAGLESVVRLDGHGRPIETVVPADGDRRTTRTVYLGTGERVTVRRSSDRDPRFYERSMSWDSFGRLVVNNEPNSGGSDAAGVLRSWRYVYDGEGRLAATSDARGCGKDLHYDALGRLLAEDFSPCSSEQPAYTAPNLGTGAGTEAYYRYDRYEPGQVEPTQEFDHGERLALGHLISIQDRGAHTRLSYDERGRVRRVARRIAKPGPTEFTLADRYAQHWFKQEATFDLGDRLRKRTTGIDDVNLQVNGESFESVTYTARGAVHALGSSYGTLVSGLTYAASGLPMEAQYGDRANTRVARGYDGRDRLRHLRAFRTSAPGIWATPLSADYPVPGSETTQLNLAHLEFAYDDVDNPTTITDSSAAVWPRGASPVSRAFGYDPAYRLTHVGYSHTEDQHVPAFLPEALAGDRRPIAERTTERRVKTEDFKFDWQGNVRSAEDDARLRFDRSLGPIRNGSGLDGVARGPNQLIEADGVRARYDSAGNLVELTVARDGCWPRMPDCSHRFLYDWDEVGEISRARRWDFGAGVVPDLDPNAPPVWDLHYIYGDGGRVLTSRTDASGDTRHTLDVFDTLRVASTVFHTAAGDYRADGTNEVGFLGGVARVFLDRGRELPVAGATPIHVYLSLADHLGSTAFVIDKDSGEVVERTAYQAFGVVDADYRPNRWGGAREEYKFTGKGEDVEVGLAHFGARFYNARLGRWMSPDPLVIHALAGDLNPYAYVSGQVASHVDPWGLDKIPAGASDVQHHAGGWSAIVNGQLEVGNYDSSDRGVATPERGGARDLDRADPRSVTNLVLGSAHIPIPGTKSAYFTPTGIRKVTVNAVNSTLTGILDPVGYRHVLKVAGVDIEGLFQVEVSEDDDDESAIVGAVAVTIASVIVGSRAGTRYGGHTGPGRYAGRSVPANGAKYGTQAQRAALKGAPCHTCGTTNYGTKSGLPYADHQPSNALNPTGGPQRLYPQCSGCSSNQGNEVKGIINQLRRLLE